MRSVEETYGKFKLYLNYLRGELSDEIRFLNEVDAAVLNYDLKEGPVPQTIAAPEKVGIVKFVLFAIWHIICIR